MGRPLWEEIPSAVFFLFTNGTFSDKIVGLDMGREDREENERYGFGGDKEDAGGPDLS